jgi:endoglucanase
MKTILFKISFLRWTLAAAGMMINICFSSAQSWIRINQLGYLPESVKVAVFISENQAKFKTFSLCDALTGKTVFSGTVRPYPGDDWGMKSAGRLDFSAFTKSGGYYLKVSEVKSPVFRISADAYRGTADYILKYLRQQQCGYNPWLKDSCHTHDGIIVDHPTKTGQIIDVKGGWHDATDYLQYVTTTSNAVYELFYAWERNPAVYGDSYNSSGDPGSNGIPDILDQALWGTSWLLKMNPSKGEMYNQVADDRDHVGFRLPNADRASYGLGSYRPVYYITGKPQGLSKYKNRTEGVSSAAGKFSSAFSIAAEVMKKFDAGFSSLLQKKAEEAFEFGLTDIGTTQTACNVSPYFYEEDNYADDLELAAWQLFSTTRDSAWLTRADYWGNIEPVTPWIEKDTARHYQFYPFMNMGHAGLALSHTGYASRYIYYMRKGLEILKNRRVSDPFQVKVPFTWCSNNFVTAALQQHMLYYEATGDNTFREQEAALRDWLFGCNPWGTSMLVGIPEGGDYPEFPHSSYTVRLGIPVYGGLVDGPVWSRIYRNLKGIELTKSDPYGPFQNGKAVYHDDTGDYSTNEPTMDGTACLSFVLSSLETEGRRQGTVAGGHRHADGEITDDNGAITRMDKNEKSVYLIFSADEFGEGAPRILDILSTENIKGSFFLTGNYLREPVNEVYLKRMIKEGHFVGPHSDRHLLYASWEKRDSLLVSKDIFIKDLAANYGELKKKGADLSGPRYFLPPYEWYNSAIANWTGDIGSVLINLTPGTGTNADYTTPDMKNYRSSESLIAGLKYFDVSQPDGLNGAFILIHLGTDPARTDKLYNRLGEIIAYLRLKGYNFKRL